MPELPEVEIVCRGLAKVLEGVRIDRVEQRRPELRFPFPARFVHRLQGRTVRSMGRRAKYLLARLDSGDVLVMHLGMSGRFTVSRSRRSASQVLGDYEFNTGANPKHDHVVMETARGATITYNDPRRFGFMLLIPEEGISSHPLFSGIGVEPLGNELNAAYLAQRAMGRKTDLKSFLMDQRHVAGLGNIYVSEALHRAGLSPLRPACTLAARSGHPTDRAHRLSVEIRNVLGEAIAAGGSTLRDYRRADGTRGGFQDAFLVYDRAEKPCARTGCKGTVQRITQAGRATYFCRSCQK